jgi:hypothetical protein
VPDSDISDGDTRFGHLILSIPRFFKIVGVRTMRFIL